jgi:glutamyl/glutaminyl-tRNA synthetase
LRNEDLDAVRFRMDFVKAMIEDLRWFGLNWEEGPDVGGPHAPYNQSERRPSYRKALERLHSAGLIYPCTRTRRDVLEAARAPHEGGADDEPVFPAEFRPGADAPVPPLEETISVNWRMRVPDGEELGFTDGNLGPQRCVSGRDFGDFLVWRKDDCPSYQLACAVDDAEMEVTEVVRGADLVRSTFRQLLVYRALDDKGERLAKRHDALSLRSLRERGMTPQEIIRSMNQA